MQRQIEEVIGRAIARRVDAVQRRPARVISGMLLLTAVSAVYAVDHIGVKGDTDSLFSRDLAFKRAERRYHQAFPTQYENMFVVIDGPTPERAGEAASELAERLGAMSGSFHRVYLPGGGTFFEQHAFLYLEMQELEDLADDLAEVQPYLAQLARDGSLRGLASMMARGVQAVRDGDIEGKRLAAIFDRFSESLNASAKGEKNFISWAEVLAAGSFAGDARTRFLLVQPVLAFADIQPAKRAILAVRRAAKELGLTEANGIRVRVTGDLVLSYEEMEVVKGQAARAGAVSFVLVGLILGVGLRSLRLVLATLFTLAVGLVLTVGFTALAIGHFNLISASFAVLFIGLGVDFGIHLCVRYRELMAHGREHARALTESAGDVGSSLVLCAATTAIGFFAFVPTDFLGVAELGIISGAGMFISLFCTLTLLPAFLSLAPLPKGTGQVGGIAWSGARLTSLPLRHPGAVRAAALVLGVGAICLLPKARFDTNPLNVRDPSAESVRTFNELLEKGSSSPWMINVMTSDLESAQELAEQLRELDVVGRVVTVADYIPEDQEEKLDIIEDVALLLSPMLGPEGEVARPSFEAQVASLRHLEREVAVLLEQGGGEGLKSSSSRLAESLGNYLTQLEAEADPHAAVAELEEMVMGSLPEQLRILSSALTAGHVTLEKLPEALIERMMSEDGRLRVQVFPAGDLNDRAELAAFVDGVKTVAPELAGSACEIVESGRAVVRALRQAMFSAVVVVTLLLLLLWRRLDDTALVLVPLALASALTVGAAVLADIPFNFADVIVLPLLLGIGVDTGIHLVHRARVSVNGDLNLLRTSTARAVVISALTTVASFGTMGLASHRGLATLGQLLTLGVAFTVLCNLILLPSLIVLRTSKLSSES